MANGPMGPLVDRPLWRLSWLALSLLALAAAAGAAEAPAEKDVRDYADMSIEELMDVSVTSVAKKATRLDLSPAAVAVVTSDDLRRLGITTIPEALRTVTGMDVARINANEWAVSSRGFNNEFANSLLVLIDGRTVYTPASAGVFWNAQDVMIEDLDRIEVIRGPGATLWGANAVNGVVNVTSKSAKDTQGTLVSTSYGTEDEPSVTVRYGGQIATDLYYRAYVKYFNRDGLVDASGQATADDWHTTHEGFRADWEPSATDKVTFQGDAYRGEAEKNVDLLRFDPLAIQSVGQVEQNTGSNALARFTRTFGATSALTLQAYYDRVKQGDGFGTEYRNTSDIDLQHRFALGARQDVVWGAGYRDSEIKNTPSFNLTWTPEIHQVRLFNLFAQDEITLVPDRWHLTLGSKVEHNNLIGWELDPGGRLLWTPTRSQTLWAAVSRATRTPSLFEQSSRLNVTAFQPSPGSPVVLVSFFGNPNLDAEKVIAYELGYRIEPNPRLSFDLACFYNRYRDLDAVTPGPPSFETSPDPPHVLLPSVWQNALSAENYGTELSVHWQVTRPWRLSGGYTWLHMHVHPNPALNGESPGQQAQIHSYLDLSSRWELNGSAYYVGTVAPPVGAGHVDIPSYIRLDVGVVWRPTPPLEIGLWGQNLTDPRHAEFANRNSAVLTQVPRSFLIRITKRF
jgi:iron complex outermembrane receptor protein